MKLFVFYLGGAAPRANIEVHDVQFAAVEKPEDAHPILVRNWYGIRASLHIDAYGIVDWADGFAVHIAKEKPSSPYRLYFINMGGYKAGALGEEHEFTFIVAESEEDAKLKATASNVLVGLDHRHRDNLMAVDDCVLLEEIDGHYVHLTPRSDGNPVTAVWQGYQPI